MRIIASLALFASLCVTGCDSPARTTITPSHAAAKSHREVYAPATKTLTTTTAPDGTTKTVETTKEAQVVAVEDHEADANTAGGETKGQKFDQKIETTQPKVGMPGGPTATGGGVDAEATGTGTSNWPWWLIVGIVLILGAVGEVAWAYKDITNTPQHIRIAVGLFIGGACCVVLNFIPGYIILLGILAGIVVFGILLYNGHSASSLLAAGKAKLEDLQAKFEAQVSALTAHTKAVQSAPPEAQAAVAAGLKSADPSILATIAAAPHAPAS